MYSRILPFYSIATYKAPIIQYVECFQLPQFWPKPFKLYYNRYLMNMNRGWFSFYYYWFLQAQTVLLIGCQYWKSSNTSTMLKWTTSNILCSTYFFLLDLARVLGVESFSKTRAILFNLAKSKSGLREIVRDLILGSSSIC